MEQENNEDEQSKSKKIAVAAIDFGTTYSGFAFSWKTDWRKVQVNNWNSGTFMSSKTPTTLLLNPDQTFHAFGYEAETLYSNMAEGNSSDSDDEEEKRTIQNYSEFYYFHRFKMLLYENNNLHRESTIEDITGKTMKALDIFSISLKYLQDFMLEIMNKNIASGVISKENIDFVLTVPAIWGDGAKLFMREAAIKAGIKTNQLTLALEPEAASIFCQQMHYLNKDNPEDHQNTFQKFVKKGNKYMVVDLGGGTVDITVHKQADDGTLEELIPATGGPTGGVTVDKEFEKFLEKIGGSGILKSFAEISMEDHLTMLREFEIKKREDPKSKVHIKIPLKLDSFISKKKPGGISKALKNTIYKDIVTYKQYKICLPFSEYETFFRTAVDGVLKHIDAILSKKEFNDVKNIIMVGGFSECKLIQRAVREKFKSCRFIIPDAAGLAVLRGAVYFGHLPNAISRRVARYTYGIKICPPFKSGEHPEDKKITVDRSERCKNVFFPLVRRGDQIKPGREEPIICQSLNPKRQKIECGIYVSNRENPQFIDEKDCRLLCKLTVKIPPGVYSAEIEESIIFGETEITFRAKQLESGCLTETSVDMLDIKCQPHTYL